MKRRDLLRRIRDEAKRQGVEWAIEREGRVQRVRGRGGREVVEKMSRPARSYHAEVRRSVKYWAVYVREIDRWTQARHLRELDTMTTDLIEVMTGAEKGTFVVEYDIELPEAVRARLVRAEQLRAESAQAQAAAVAEVRAAARELHQGGLPLRDVGQLLGISHQRAHQLVTN